jgi:hypothetical protein
MVERVVSATNLSPSAIVCTNCNCGARAVGAAGNKVAAIPTLIDFRSQGARLLLLG